MTSFTLQVASTCPQGVSSGKEKRQAKEEKKRALQRRVLKKKTRGANFAELLFLVRCTLIRGQIVVSFMSFCLLLDLICAEEI